MRTSAILFGLLISALSLKAGVKIDVVAIPQEEIVRRAIPVICDISRKDDGSLILKLMLRDLFGVNSEFVAYELRVLKEPVSISTMKKEFFDLNLIARRKSCREKVAEFELKKDEIPNSYIVITSSLGHEDGILKLRSICVSVPALVIQ